MKPSAEIADLCQALVHGLSQALGDKLYGVYVYGAAAFPEAVPSGDIDFHVAEYPDYCILNLCRLKYSFETQDVVVSKAAAAAWALAAFPEWRRHIELASKSYARQATTQDRQFMMAEVTAFYRFACQHIENSRSARNAGAERERAINKHRRKNDSI